MFENDLKKGRIINKKIINNQLVILSHQRVKYFKGCQYYSTSIGLEIRSWWTHENILYSVNHYILYDI